MPGEERSDPFSRHVAAVDVDASGEPAVLGELTDRLAGLAPHLARDREGDVRDTGHGAQQDVDPLVAPDETEGEDAGRTLVDRPVDGLAPRQVRGEL